MLSAPDVLIVGGGPAGAAAACRLASAGRRVLLCERERQARPRVCGEFLSAAACAELVDLGVLPRDLGAAPISHIRMIHGAGEARSALPFAACGLSRELLDEQLLARAEACGVDVRRGLALRRLERSRHVWRAASDGLVIEAPAVLLATGKHDLRTHPRPRRAGAAMIGFKMHWRLADAENAALAEHVELVWFDGGYGGLQPIERGLANLCVVVTAAAFAERGKSFSQLLEHLGRTTPHFGMRLRGAEPIWPRPATIAGVPYGHLHRDGAGSDGLFRIGDQFAVIPSFTGEGVALALRTARLAARDVGRPMRRAGSLARLMNHSVGRQLALPLSHLPGLLPALAQAVRVS